MSERLSNHNLEQEVLNQRRIQIVSDIIVTTKPLADLSDEAKQSVVDSLTGIATSLEERYNGKWNRMRWGVAWIEMIEEGDEHLNRAFGVFQEELLLKAFKKMFLMYEAGVTSMDALDSYRELSRIKSPQATVFIAGSSRRSRRNYHPDRQ